MSAYTIVANVGVGMSTATGRPGQSHLVYAANTANWWLFYISSTASLSAVLSSNFSSWGGPSSGSPFSLADAHRGIGLNFGFSCTSIASTDVVHMVSTYITGAGSLASHTFHTRFTLGTALTNTNAEAATGVIATGVASASYISGAVTTMDSNNLPNDLSPFWLVTATTGELEAAAGSNDDSGTSWTAGFALPVLLESGTNRTESNAILALGSGNLMAIGDNSSSTGQFTNLMYSYYNGTSWSGSTGLMTAVTATDANAWGAVARTGTDVHVVSLSNNSNAYVHYRWNGTSWSAGNTIPNLAYGTTAGVFLATDGTSVWAATIDTSSNVQVIQWTSGGGWGTWTVAAGNSAASTYLSGYQQVVGTSIGLIWTLVDGSNYDIAGTLFNTVPGFPVGTISCSVP